MLKEKINVFKKLMIFADILLVGGSFFLAYLFRDTTKDGFPLENYFFILPVIILTWTIFLYRFGLYTSFRTKPTSEIIFTILKTGLFAFIIVSSFAYVVVFIHVDRSVLAATFLVAEILTIFERFVLVIFFRAIRKRGMNFRNILIVGSGKRAQHFIELVNEHTEWGLKIFGVIDEDSSRHGQEVLQQKIIGALKDIPDIIQNNVIDEIVFIVPRDWLGKIEEALHFCESQGLRIHVAVDYFELKFSRAKQSDLHGFPLLTFETTPDKLWHLLGKRIFDFCASCCALILLTPLFIVVAILIKLTSSGPIFFCQERSTLNGRKFLLYKFRTMVKDAEQKLKDLLVHNEMQGPVFKMENDPRLTPIGKFLRKFSIDELPQLWNVLVGDMSLVGPRPPIPSEVAKYEPWQRRRLSMRPGITCIWQVSGRSKIIDFNEWMKLDLEYIDNWSLWLDTKILIKTIPVVLFGIGAK